MKSPVKKHLRKTLRDLSLLVLGAVLGALAIVVHTGKQMDDLYLERKQLEQEMLSLREEVQSLESRLHQKQNTQVVEKLLFTIEEAPDGFTETEIIKRLQEAGKFFIGKEVKTLSENPDILFYFFDNRLFFINDRWLRIQTRTVSISNLTHIWLRVKVEKEKAP